MSEKAGKLEQRVQKELNKALEPFLHHKIDQQMRLQAKDVMINVLSGLAQEGLFPVEWIVKSECDIDPETGGVQIPLDLMLAFMDERKIVDN